VELGQEVIGAEAGHEGILIIAVVALEAEFQAAHQEETAEALLALQIVQGFISLVLTIFITLLVVAVERAHVDTQVG
jgi:hypothetical protein